MRYLVFVLIVLVLVSGCTQQTPNQLEDTSKVEEKEAEKQNLHIDEKSEIGDQMESLNQSEEDIQEEQNTSSKDFEEPETKITKQNQYPIESQTTFYKDGNIVFDHHWPNTQSLGGDESEVFVYNDGNSVFQVKSTDMVFVAGGKSYSQYSGTWEKFPSRSSWERIEYINIHPNYYKNEPLVLQPGQKGKIHYHYQFPGDISGKQEAKIKITYLVGGEEKKVDQTLTRIASEPN